MEKISLAACSVPLLDQVDVCVAGGSCSGVFAAVRAAQAGCKVAIIEAQNRFGGTASASQVCIWHSLYAMDSRTRIIAGLTQEIIDRLSKRDAVTLEDKPNPSIYAILNTEELAIELDEMILENQVRPYLHSRVVQVWRDDSDKVAGVIFAGQGGLFAIKARVFVDATGDADLCAAAGLPLWRNPALQPPTACAKFSAWPQLRESLGKLIHDAAERYRLPEGMVWGSYSPAKNTYMLAGTKIPDLDLSAGAALTAAEIEGRRQLRAIQDLVAEAGYPRPVLEALPSLIGIRDTRHIHSLYRVSTDDILYGRDFPDVVARGTYRVDVHSQDPPGCRFLYLDGREIFISPHQNNSHTHWRDPSLPTPPFYQAPLRSMIPAGVDNIITAGRMIDAESGAFGALRVMVNLNQCGEAAGTVAAMAVSQDLPIPAVRYRAELP
jgi:glycine/D-amino acid oxidase-like deaminating enzyme